MKKINKFDFQNVKMINKDDFQDFKISIFHTRCEFANSSNNNKNLFMFDKILDSSI